MKRFIIVAFTILYIMALPGCHRIPLIQDEPNSPADFGSHSQHELEIAGIDEGEPLFDTVMVRKGIFQLKYDLVDISVEFPQLSGYPNRIMEESINKLLYNFVVTEELADWCEWRREVEIGFEISFASKDFLSVVFSGENNYYGGYSDYGRAITIDLNTGKALSLSDFFSPNEAYKIINNNMASENCIITDEVLNELKYKEDFKPIFLDYFQDNVNFSHNDDFYIRKGILGLITDISPIIREKIFAEFLLEETQW